jgi:hypothetical protein
MPSEFRFLVFSPTESAQALATFARKRGRKLPDGYLNYAIPGAGTPPSGRLFVTPDEGKDQEAGFAAEEVVASLRREGVGSFAVVRKRPVCLADWYVPDAGRCGAGKADGQTGKEGRQSEGVWRLKRRRLETEAKAPGD